MEITIKKLEEAGYNQALLGLSFNKKTDVKRMPVVAEKLAPCDGGHNKFLEHILTWWEVRAPRYWWQEADTYRHSSKSSESTMHTLEKELKCLIDNDQTAKFAKENFEDGFISNAQLSMILDTLAWEDSVEKLVAMKQLLPENFMQKRMWVLNYKTLRNIIIQRRSHRLPHWPHFCLSVLEQVAHPELLPPITS